MKLSHALNCLLFVMLFFGCGGKQGGKKASSGSTGNQQTKTTKDAKKSAGPNAQSANVLRYFVDDVNAVLVFHPRRGLGSPLLKSIPKVVIRDLLDWPEEYPFESLEQIVVYFKTLSVKDITGESETPQMGIYVKFADAAMCQSVVDNLEPGSNELKVSGESYRQNQFTKMIYLRLSETELIGGEMSLLPRMLKGENPKSSLAERIAQSNLAVDLFLAGQFEPFRAVAKQFTAPFSQIPSVKPLLPIIDNLETLSFSVNLSGDPIVQLSVTAKDSQGQTELTRISNEGVKQVQAMFASIEKQARPTLSKDQLQLLDLAKAFVTGIKVRSQGNQVAVSLPKPQNFDKLSGWIKPHVDAYAKALRAGSSADEDPEVLAYFKKKDWTLAHYNRQADDQRLVLLSIKSDTGELVKLDDEDRKMIVTSKTVQFLDFDGVATTDSDLQEIATMTRLEGIDLSGETMTDNGIKSLADCKSLREISLKYTRKVTDKGIEELAALPNLFGIQVHGTKLSGEGFAPFAGSKTLQSIGLEMVPGFTDAGARHLAKLPNLNRLHLNLLPSSKLTTAGIRTIVDNGLPKYFTVDASLIDDDLLASLVTQGWLHRPGVEGKPATASEVEIISLLGAKKVTDKGFEEVLDCSNAKHLLLTGTAISDITLNKLTSFKQIATLELAQTKVKGDGLKAIEKCPIERINLGGCSLSENAFVAIGKMTKIDYLILGSAKFKSDWLKHLSGLKQVKRVTINGQGFDDLGASHLEKLKSVESLSLDGTKLGDKGFAALLKLPKLRGMSINETKVSKDAFLKAKKAHPKLQLSNFKFENQ